MTAQPSNVATCDRQRNRSVLHVARRWGLFASIILAVTFTVVEIVNFKAYLTHVPNTDSFGEVDRSYGYLKHDIDSPYYFETNTDSKNTNQKIPTGYSVEFLPPFWDGKIKSSAKSNSFLEGGTGEHHRVACFSRRTVPFDDYSCNIFRKQAFNSIHYNVKDSAPSSIPKITDDVFQTETHYEEGTTSEDAIFASNIETDECKYPDPSFQLSSFAPSTCNDVHSLGLDFSSFSGENFRNHVVDYITSGGFRSVWSMKFWVGEEDGLNTFIVKTNRMSHNFHARYLDQQRRDGLISEKVGRSPYTTIATSGRTLADLPENMWNNVLPMYQLCAFTNVVPYATAGPLDDYIEEYSSNGEGKILSAIDILQLALQAARGLYQMHLYVDGKPSFTHSDVKPAQFLAYHVPNQKSSLPVLQISDFNRGSFLTRSIDTNNTCPFRMCDVKHKGSLYRSPEEYMDCADQDEKIDVFSLGGVFFFLLSDGKKPYHDSSSYEKAVKKVLKGKLPHLPKLNEYEREVADQVRERAYHPAYRALQKVMLKCWAYEPQHRPSSLEVVRILEQELRKME
ncbi:hypothetical protein ACHAXS_004975 [Conticribra weissflogii]